MELELWDALYLLAGGVFVAENVWLWRLWTALNRERKYRANEGADYRMTIKQEVESRERIERDFRDYLMRQNNVLPRKPGGDE